MGDSFKPKALGGCLGHHYGAGHIVAVPLQAARLAKYSYVCAAVMQSTILLITSKSGNLSDVNNIKLLLFLQRSLKRTSIDASLLTLIRDVPKRSFRVCILDWHKTQQRPSSYSVRTAANRRLEVTVEREATCDRRR